MAEGGIGNLTIHHISKRLNLTEAALYAHFSGKLEIIQALVSRFEGKVDEMDESQLGWAAVEAALASKDGTGVGDARPCPRGVLGGAAPGRQGDCATTLWA